MALAMGRAECVVAPVAIGLVLVGLAFPCPLQASLTAFAVANAFCEKTLLGAEPISSYEQALESVVNNQFYDPDYALPGWKRAVANEMFRLCPSEYKKLVTAYSLRKRALAKEAAAMAAEKARWDALPESVKNAEREKLMIKQRELEEQRKMEKIKEQEKDVAEHENRRLNYCRRKCASCRESLRRNNLFCSKYVSYFFPYLGIYPYSGEYACDCDKEL